MKRLFLTVFFALVAISGILVACSSDSENPQPMNREFNLKTSTDSLVIGYVEDGRPIFTGNEADILDKWNYNLRELYDINAEMTSLSVIYESTEDAFYLRGKGVDWSSTMLLELQSHSMSLKLTGVTCTSRKCSASSTECVPKKDGKACTKCDWGLGDCTKSVTSTSQAIQYLDYSAKLE